MLGVQVSSTNPNNPSGSESHLTCFDRLPRQSTPSATASLQVLELRMDGIGINKAT